MISRISILIILLTTFVNASDIAKASISKLIDRSYMLEKRVKLLEEKVAYLTKYNIKAEAKKSGVLQNIFYVPKKSGFVRKAPYKKAKAIAIANKKTQIFKIFCRKNHNIVWGKNSEGWIYISNPRYGEIVNDNNISIYKIWCKE